MGSRLTWTYAPRGEGIENHHHLSDAQVATRMWFCECAEPDIRGWIGMCHICYRKPRALMNV